MNSISVLFLQSWNLIQIYIPVSYICGCPFFKEVEVTPFCRCRIKISINLNSLHAVSLLTFSSQNPADNELADNGKHDQNLRSQNNHDGPWRCNLSTPNIERYLISKKTETYGSLIVNEMTWKRAGNTIRTCDYFLLAFLWSVQSANLMCLFWYSTIMNVIISPKRILFRTPVARNSCHKRIPNQPWRGRRIRGEVAGKG